AAAGHAYARHADAGQSSRRSAYSDDPLSACHTPRGRRSAAGDAASAFMSHDAIKDILVLLQLTEQLADGRPLEDALRAVTDAALELLPGDHASIRLVDASSTQLLSGARSGTGRDTPIVRLGVGEGVSGWVLANGKPARVIDTREDPRFKNVPG